MNKFSRAILDMCTKKMLPSSCFLYFLLNKRKIKKWNCVLMEYEGYNFFYGQNLSFGMFIQLTVTSERGVDYFQIYSPN